MAHALPSLLLSDLNLINQTVIIGDQNVGKSSILLRYSDNVCTFSLDVCLVLTRNLVVVYTAKHANDWSGLQNKNIDSQWQNC